MASDVDANEEVILSLIWIMTQAGTPKICLDPSTLIPWSHLIDACPGRETPSLSNEIPVCLQV